MSAAGWGKLAHCLLDVSHNWFDPDLPLFMKSHPSHVRQGQGGVKVGSIVIIRTTGALITEEVIYWIKCGLGFRK